MSLSHIWKIKMKAMQTTTLKELPDINNQIRLAPALYIIQV